MADALDWQRGAIADDDGGIMCRGSGRGEDTLVIGHLGAGAGVENPVAAAGVLARWWHTVERTVETSGRLRWKLAVGARVGEGRSRGRIQSLLWSITGVGAGESRGRRTLDRHGPRLNEAPPWVGQECPWRLRSATARLTGAWEALGAIVLLALLTAVPAILLGGERWRGVAMFPGVPEDGGVEAPAGGMVGAANRAVLASILVVCS